jgi:hypothetical protein
VGREIRKGEPRRARDRLRHLAQVETRRALALDAAQRVRELGQRIDVAGPRRGPGRAGARERPVLRNALGGGNAPLGRIDGTCERGVEPEPAVAFGQVGPGTDRAGHGHRARPRLVDLQLGELGRRAAGAVQPPQLSLPPDLREEIAADPRVTRLGDAQHRRRGERRIDRVPAVLERPDARA